MKNILIVFLCFIIGCTTKGTWVGSYYRKFETIELRDDSTFKYIFRIEQPLAISNGQWRKIDNNQLIFRSQYDVNNLPIKVEEEFLNKTKEKIVEVKPEGNFKTSGENIRYSLILNEQDTLYNKNNIFTLSSEIKPKDIRLKISYGINDGTRLHLTDHIFTEIYKVKNINSDKFIIHFPLNLEMFLYENIKNDTLLMRGSKLIWEKKSKKYLKKTN